MNLKDNVIITYEFENPEHEIAQAVDQFYVDIQNLIRKKLVKFCPETKYAFIAIGDNEIDGENLTIRISSNVLIPAVATIKADFPKQAEDIIQVLGSFNADIKDTTAKGSLKVTIDEVAVELVKDTHYSVLY